MAILFLMAFPNKPFNARVKNLKLSRLSFFEKRTIESEKLTIYICLHPENFF